jgi:hypothetical protein
MLSPGQPLDPRRRELRRRLRALSIEPLMRGSIVERRRRCGRRNCACFQDDRARHPGKFLAVHLEGRTQVLHLRPEDEAYVRRAIDAYERLWTLINELTTCEIGDLRRQAQQRQRARRRARS